jgi:uncharacterized membrane protein
MQPARVLRHLATSARRTRALFTPAVRGAIEEAIGAAEQQHAGEIRFVIETALPWHLLWHGTTPRRRALALFAQLHIWDTEHNNGVLIYLLRADRAVEIIADRGINARVSEAEWQRVCREVEQEYRAGRYLEGSRAAVSGVARLLRAHFPKGGAQGDGHDNDRGNDRGNELPNQPILL